MVAEIIPGLAGVPVTESCISFVDGKNGVLEYRGIPIQTLAEQSNHLEVAYLLLTGNLPTKDELAKWKALIFRNRQVPESVLNALAAVDPKGHPMHALAVGLQALAMFEKEATADRGQDHMAAVKIIAQAPTVVAAFCRLSQGKEPIAPNADLGYAANFLWMLKGEKPSDLETEILDRIYIIHADHTLNASTFSSRVTGSTGANPYMVATAAVATLHGPLHGGANEAVLRQLRSIGKAQAVESWMNEMLKKKEKVMGLGHRVYKVKDPRALAIQALVPELFKALGNSKEYEIALEIERVAKEKLAAKGIYPNVDFFSGLVYEKLGIPIDSFTPMFAIARFAGLLAHYFEQKEDNKLYRPAQIYTGKHDQPLTPVDQRKPTQSAWHSLF